MEQYRHRAMKSWAGVIFLTCIVAPIDAASSERCSTNQLGHCLKQSYLVRKDRFGTALQIRTKELAPRSAAHSNSSPRAQISEQRLEQLSNGDGIWRGKIKGLGRVMLRLVISSPSGFKESHLIGQISLAHQKPPVQFSYRRALPALAGWSWKIVAHPTT